MESQNSFNMRLAWCFFAILAAFDARHNEEEEKEEEEEDDSLYISWIALAVLARLTKDEAATPSSAAMPFHLADYMHAPGPKNRPSLKERIAELSGIHTDDDLQATEDAVWTLPDRFPSLFVMGMERLYLMATMSVQEAVQDADSGLIPTFGPIIFPIAQALAGHMERVPRLLMNEVDGIIKNCGWEMQQLQSVETLLQVRAGVCFCVSIKKWHSSLVSEHWIMLCSSLQVNGMHNQLRHEQSLTHWLLLQRRSCGIENNTPRGVRGRGVAATR